MIDQATFQAMKDRVAVLESQVVSVSEHQHEYSGYRCMQPARARTREQLSKRRLVCAACMRPLTRDLVFEYVSPRGKRQVYCAREDCAAL